MKKSQYFRAGVGIVVLDDDSCVLALERYDVPGAWQLPQGGLEESEEPLQAARRELREETRLHWHQVELLGEHPSWLAYELPRDSWTAKTGRGQVQRWFVVNVVDATAKIETHHVGPDKGHPEFRAHRWMRFDELLDVAVEFRRPLYKHLADFVGSLNPLAHAESSLRRRLPDTSQAGQHLRPRGSR